MTWSRRVSSAAMVRAACPGDVVAAGRAGFDDEVFAAQFAQVVGGLPDGVVVLALAGERVDFGREVGDGEPVG